MRLLVAVAVVFAIIIVLAWTFQRKLVYFPMGSAKPVPPAWATGVEEITLRTDDGVELGAWFLPTPSRISVIVFNGNAGSRLYRLPFARLLTSMGASVLLFDYRGFGGNSGNPSRTGLGADARAARAYLDRRHDPAPPSIVYFGESLGAAVAAELAVTHPPSALILRSPFTSLVEIGRHHYPFLPVGWLTRDRFSVIDAVPKIRVPTLVIAGDRDGIVPVSHSRRVFDAAAGPKELVIVPGADHNDEALFTGEMMMRAIERLLRSLQ